MLLLGSSQKEEITYVENKLIECTAFSTFNENTCSNLLKNNVHSKWIARCEPSISISCIDQYVEVELEKFNFIDKICLANW